jgi:hypothetical protein
MTEGQAVALKILRRKLGIEGDLDHMMGKEEASDLISSLQSRLDERENPPSRPWVDPHAHLPAIGTPLDLHAKIDYRLFISDEWERRKAYEIRDSEQLASYFRDCPGRFVVAEYVPGAPIVVAKCNLCEEPFAYKVAIP